MATLKIQTHRFTLNYLYALDANGANRVQYARETGVLASLFQPAADEDDDGSAWFTPPAGFEVQEVVVTEAEPRLELEEHHLGWGLVLLEVRGHTYTTFPIDAIATAIDARIFANMASFTPDLTLVGRDDFWQQRILDVAGRVPCVITQHAGTSGQSGEF